MWRLIYELSNNPSDSTHGNSHSPFYEGSHWDYHFSLLSFGKPVPLFTISNVSNGNPLWDSISSFKALYILWGVYQMSKSTHFVRDR